MHFSESRLALSVRPNDLDALGHVNNAVALEYFEAGRWDWLALQGLTLGTRVVAVVARIEVDYAAEIRGGTVEVRTSLESPTPEEIADDAVTYRARFRQTISRDGESRPAVSAVVTVAFVDPARRCAVSMQDFLAASVGP
jgi:acyl-CoA thioester hydrolase